MTTKKSPLSLAFDIGHSSIGWAVLSEVKPQPDLLGCGSVIFPKDDCLASSRRVHRRMRRNIRATRQRIRRMKALLNHLNVLSEKELNLMGHPAPHALAARALSSEQACLTWLELWHVLRWYAHNRGYDGNSRWSRQEDESEDTEKEKAALLLMDEHQTSTMAETICAVLDLKEGKVSSANPYKTLNAAFPRKVVRGEVLTILERHKGHLDQLDDDFIETLIASDESSGKQAWKTIVVPEIKLPRRYFGGLLFGQLIPRFDNRIIAACPISQQKVPHKATREFLDFRWAMILANLRVNGEPLTSEQRQKVHKVMSEKGRLTPTDLRKTVEETTGTEDTNCKAYFEMHPDSGEALVLDPALALFNGEGPGSKMLAPFWNHLPEISQHRAMGRWKKGRPVTLEWMLAQCAKENHDSKLLDKAIEKFFEDDRKKKKPSFLSFEHCLRKSFAPKSLSGRAPYSRQVMRETVDFVLESNRHPAEEGGPLYRTPEILKTERDRPIDDLTNNHLIRHRLTILLRLVDDLIEEYAGGKAQRITDIVVEVARDLQEYSGLTAKEMSGELTKRLSSFKSAVTYLEKHAPDLTINGSLIRKTRIAMDLNWKCPFTGKKYDPVDLRSMEREHVIPYADRPTNALDALVLTFDWVNKLKGRRTGMRFIKDMAEDSRFFTPAQYAKFVDQLNVANPKTYPDDARRQSSRKKLMMVENYEARDHGFTQGALTKTSHLNRLSARQLESRFVDPVTNEPTVRITSIPGQVTGETRKAWRLLGCLAQACPDCEGKTKTEIRELTHLHHALDAATLAVTHHFLPGVIKGKAENEKGAIWQALLKRKKSDQQIDLLMRTGLFSKHYRKDEDGKATKKLDVHLDDLDSKLKKQITARLSEMRVVQHIPADQSGADLEETTWRFHGEHNGQALLSQATSRSGRNQNRNVSYFRWEDSEFKKATAKLLPQVEHLLTKKEVGQVRRGLLKITKEPLRSIVGKEDGKLSKNKAARVISTNFGIALGKTPQIIPYHDVPARLKRIRNENEGKIPPIIRNGSIISVSEGTWKGLWRVTSLKESDAYGLSVDIAHPERCKKAKGNAKIFKMLESGLKLVSPPLTGITPSDLVQD